MSNPLIRNALAVMAGLVAAMIAMAIVQTIGDATLPPPPDLAGVEDPAQAMELIPVEAQIAMALAWFLGALAGACAAIAISRRVLPAWIVGLLIALLGVWSTRMIPHPDWLLAASAVLPLVAVLFAKRLMLRRIEAV